MSTPDGRTRLPSLSVQVQQATQPVSDWLNLAAPAWLKWLDWSPSGIGALRSYKASRPDCRVVGRAVEQPGWSWEDQHRETLRLHAALGSLVGYWELPNEPACSLDEVRSLTAWTVQHIANAPEGFKGVIGNFARGCPAGTSPQDQAGLVAWQAFYPAMRMAQRRGWLLGVHEYGAPRMETDVPWLCGRYAQLVWPALPKDLQDLEVVVGECGLEQPGWLSLTTPEDYTEQLRRYLARWDGGPRCRAAFVFLLGAYPGGGWEGFDVVSNKPLAQYVRAQSGSPVPKPVVPAAMWLAVCPSNQDTNRFVDAGKPSSEQAQMALLAGRLLGVSRDYPAVSVRVFTGTPESQDTGHLSGLRAQLTRAREWLDTAPAGTLTVSLSLHSDSGASHLGGYWREAPELAQRLARQLVAGLLAYWPRGTASMFADYSDYLFAGLAGRHCPVLVEVGSHESAGDLAIVRDRGYVLARALLRACLGFFGLPA